MFHLCAHQTRHGPPVSRNATWSKDIYCGNGKNGNSISSDIVSILRSWNFGVRSSRFSHLTAYEDHTTEFWGILLGFSKWHPLMFWFRLLTKMRKHLLQVESWMLGVAAMWKEFEKDLVAMSLSITQVCVRMNNNGYLSTSTWLANDTFKTCYETMKNHWDQIMPVNTTKARELYTKTYSASINQRNNWTKNAKFWKLHQAWAVQSIYLTQINKQCPTFVQVWIFDWGFQSKPINVDEEVTVCITVLRREVSFQHFNVESKSSVRDSIDIHNTMRSSMTICE